MPMYEFEFAEIVSDAVEDKLTREEYGETAEMLVERPRVRSTAKGGMEFGVSYRGMEFIVTVRRTF